MLWSVLLLEMTLACVCMYLEASVSLFPSQSTDVKEIKPNVLKSHRMFSLRRQPSRALSQHVLPEVYSSSVNSWKDR